jgi:hypothetical protein
LEVAEIFRRTGQDVIFASERKQIPEVYNKFFGNAFFSKPLAPPPIEAPQSENVLSQPVEKAETEISQVAQAGQFTETPEIVITPSQPSPAPLPVKSKSSGLKPIDYGFMNIIFGLGSYIQGDILGGVIVTAGSIASVALIAFTGGMFIDYEYIETDDTGEVIGWRGGAKPNPYFFAGIGVGLTTLAFGFIKPLVFNLNHRLASAIDNFDIALVSNERSKNALAVRYKHSF